MLKNVDILAPKFKMFDIVFNTEKKRMQMVLCEVPFNMKDEVKVPRLKRAYICSEIDKRTWGVEMQENLRAATIYDKMSV